MEKEIDFRIILSVGKDCQLFMLQMERFKSVFINIQPKEFSEKLDQYFFEQGCHLQGNYRFQTNQKMFTCIEYCENEMEAVYSYFSWCFFYNRVAT